MSSPSMFRDVDSVSAAVEILQDLSVELNRRTAVARMETGRLCGELDIRLHVTRTGSPVVVEVLGPWSDVAPGECWQAVRIDPLSRVVWCGPAQTCGLGALQHFVEALLDRDVDASTGGYRAME